MNVNFVNVGVDGRITGFGSTQPDILARQNFAGEPHAIETVPEGGVDEKRHWWDGELKDRPALSVEVSKKTIVADGVDSAVLSGFPDPCTLVVDGVEHELTGGTLTLRTAMPALYEIACNHWPYLDWAVTIEAV